MMDFDLEEFDNIFYEKYLLSRAQSQQEKLIDINKLSAFKAWGQYIDS
jgi:hypothetical protein